MCGILAQYNYNQQNSINLKQFVHTLQKIQHRGHDSFGISFIENKKIHTISRKGLIKNNLNIVFDDENSKSCLGHVRYKTSGNFDSNTYQPIYGQNKFGKFSFVFNGNLSLIKYNKLFDTSYNLDSQILLYVLQNRSYFFDNWKQLLVYIQNTFDRAFCIIIMTEDTMYLLRDRFGVRPMVYTQNKDDIIISSESVLFDSDSKLYDVNPGEIIEIYKNNLESFYTYHNYDLGICLFEYVYFLNGKSTWDGINANNFRYDCGVQLGIQESDPNIISNPEDYIVIGIPETGIVGGKGYANISNIPYEQYITKNNEVNRTFILREQDRDNISKKKYIYDPKLKNKKVIIVDDSIVRGITSKNLVKSLLEIGCKEIHIRVNSPPITNICNYGIDIPDKDQLIVNNVSMDELSNFLGCNSILYLNLENIKKVIPKFNSLCTGCFNSNYKTNMLDW